MYYNFISVADICPLIEERQILHVNETQRCSS